MYEPREEAQYWGIHKHFIYFLKIFILVILFVCSDLLIHTCHFLQGFENCHRGAGGRESPEKKERMSSNQRGVK